MMTNRFKYGLICFVITILLCAVVYMKFDTPNTKAFEMIALVAFMVGIALVIEVD